MRVVNVLDPLLAGITWQQILDEMLALEVDDIVAVIRIARSRIDRPVIIA